MVTVFFQITSIFFVEKREVGRTDVIKPKQDAEPLAAGLKGVLIRYWDVKNREAGSFTFT
jgi:hypothetical protein